MFDFQVNPIRLFDTDFFSLFYRYSQFYILGDDTGFERTCRIHKIFNVEYLCPEKCFICDYLESKTVKYCIAKTDLSEPYFILRLPEYVNIKKPDNINVLLARFFVDIGNLRIDINCEPCESDNLSVVFIDNIRGLLLSDDILLQNKALGDILKNKEPSPKKQKTTKIEKFIQKKFNCSVKEITNEQLKELYINHIEKI